jgi:nitroreductase
MRPSTNRNVTVPVIGDTYDSTAAVYADQLRAGTLASMRDVWAPSESTPELRKADAMDRVLQMIRERRSVRRYTNDPVDDATVDELLESAIWAPSAVNAQPWAFGVIRDRSLLDRYAERAKAIYLTDPPVAELAATPKSTLRHLREVLSQPGYDVFHGANTLITIYATGVNDVPDCYLAGENLMLAACATGLGTCPIGLSLPLMNQPDVKDELGVPASIVAVLPIVVGHPGERPHATTRNPPSVFYRR